MSWEDSEPVFRPCPCGKGKYFVIDRSDDWGRFDQRWGLDCRPCDRQFDLFAYTVPHKGLMETHRGWVRKDLIRELTELRRKAEAKKALLRRQLRRRLSNAWLGHFEGRSKKRIWEELTSGGETYPSLATFYSHVRHSGLQEVLLRYLDVRYLSRVEKLLKLELGSLADLAAEIGNVEKAAEAKEGQARRQAFR